MIDSAKEAEEIISNEHNPYADTDDDVIFARGFCACHEKMKPLVETLENCQMTAGHVDAKEGCRLIILYCKEALKSYRRDVLGEK